MEVVCFSRFGLNSNFSSFSSFVTLPCFQFVAGLGSYIFAWCMVKKSPHECSCTYTLFFSEKLDIIMCVEKFRIPIA